MFGLIQIYFDSIEHCEVLYLVLLLGVTCVLISDEVSGLDWATFKDGLTTFANAL